ncbi:MAG: MFS transporter [Promethearchaeota archaeon]|nr:MAG: MFS transporter [Candidatus Lokiarchaeota archaeon]
MVDLNILKVTNGIRKKNLVALSGTRVLHGFGVAMFSVIYQPFILDITKSLFLTGIIVSLGSVMQFLPMPLVGRLSDKLGHKNTLIMSIPVYILSLVSLIYANSNAIYLLIFGILVYFLGLTLNTINSQFLVSVNSGSSKGFMYGIVFASYFLGTIAGNFFVIIGAGLASQFFFTLFIILLIIEGIIIFFFISNNTSHIKEKHNEEIILADDEEKMWVKFIKIPKMRVILIFFTIDIFIYGTTLSVYNGGLSDYYHLTTDQISFITIWMNITNMIFQIPAGRITDKLGKKKAILISQIFGLGFFIFNISASILWEFINTEIIILFLIFGYISLALSIVTFIPSEQIILTDIGKNKKAESYGVVSFVRGLGYIPTGVIAGLLIENVSYLAPLIISLIGVLFEIWFLLKFFNHD